MKLPRIAFYGRTLEEYRRIYDLTDETLRTKRLVDIAAGSATFRAEVTALGGAVTAVDPFYDRDGATLERECLDDMEKIAEGMRTAHHKYDFTFYGNLDRRLVLARQALATFIADYDTGRRGGGYVAGALPSLPFADGAFDVALVGHFLFTYAERLGETLVEASLREAVRVADEALVYPVLTLGGEPYRPLSTILDRLAADGIESRIEPTSFEFQKGANHRLHLSKPAQFQSKTK